MRYVFHDFPLDQVALTAAMVARALPPERYEPFIGALFASQDRWAFAQGVNSTDEMWKMAALAGMSRTHVRRDGRRHGVARRDPGRGRRPTPRGGASNSTPTFVINGEKHAGEMNYDTFAKLVPDA